MLRRCRFFKVLGFAAVLLMWRMGQPARGQAFTMRDMAFVGNAVPAAGGVAWDTDALAFFSRTGTVSSTESNAVNSLVMNAKAHGWWTVCDAIYPFIGGSSTSCSKNLKANTFNITWTAAPTFAASGVTFNGSTQFGDTGFNPSTAGGSFTLNAAHYMIYGGTQTVPSGSSLCGAVSGGNYAAIRYDSGTVATWGPNMTAAASASLPAADLRLFLLATRTDSSTVGIQVGGGNSTAAGNSSSGLPNANFYIGAENNGGLWRPAAILVKGETIGGAITAGTMVNNMKADWDALQSALGR